MAQRKTVGCAGGSRRGDGLSMNAIARTLNDEGVPTARGGKWHASTVRAVLTSETAKAL